MERFKRRLSFRGAGGEVGWGDWGLGFAGCIYTFGKWD